MKPDLELLRFATVREVTDEEAPQLAETIITAGLQDEQVLEQLRTADFRKASPSPVVNGKPRMLHMSIWLAHEGENGNGDEFIASELKEAVEERKLFADGYGGVVDRNHDMIPRGYWYASEYAFDDRPEVQKFGVLAHGAMWAWLFPTLADEMLAAQARDGGIKTSMGALSNRIEMVRKADGSSKSIIHDPVFISSSFLTVPGADANADGKISEDPTNETIDERKQELLAAALEESQMDEALNQILSALPELQAGVVEQITAAVQLQVDAAKDELLATTASLNSDLEAANARIEELTATITERDVVVENLTTERDALSERFATLEQELAEIRTAQAERDFEVLKEERFNALPKAYQARLLTKPAEIVEQLKVRYAKQSEADFALTVEELNVTVADTPRGPLPNLGTNQPTGRPVDRISRFVD